MTVFAGEPEKLERFRRGDRAVLAEVYRRYLREVAMTLSAGFEIRGEGPPRRVPGVPSRFDVENGCQEVFLRAFRPKARAAYDGDRPFGAWLERITRNWMIDRHRRSRPVASIDPDHLPSHETPPERRLHRESLARFVDAFLSALPHRDRTYYEARYRRGLSQTDAAAEQGLSRIQGRRIEARVKQQLLEAMRSQGLLGEGAQ